MNSPTSESSLTSPAPRAFKSSQATALLLIGFGLLTGNNSARAASMPITPSVGVLKKLSLEELMDIEVMSVSRHAEKLLEAPSAIQVITSEDLRRSGYSSLPQSLRLADNLAVAQKNPHDWGITARGFNTDLANKLLVLIDGRTVYTPLYSGVFWDAQDYLLEDVDRIEVISGPGSTLWGSNAVNGVINITSKSAKDTLGGFVEAGGGNELQRLAGVRYGVKFAPETYLRVYGKYLEQDSSVTAAGADSVNGSTMSRAGFRLDSTASPMNTLTLQGDFYNGHEAMATGGDGKLSGGNILGRWSHTFSSDSELDLQLYYDRTHLFAPKAASTFAGAGPLVDDLDTYDVDFQHRFMFGPRQHVVWGLGYRFTQDRVKNAPTVGFLPENLDQELFSGFAQDEIALRDGVSFTFGTKLEHNSYTGLEVEPSVRLQWKVSSKHMLWSAVSRAVRIPSRIDRDLIQPTNLAPPLPESILTGGGTGFDSETVVAYELGYRAQVTTQIAGSLSAFYNDYDNIRSITPGPPGFPKFGFPLVFRNNIEGETYGLEASVHYQPTDQWRLRAGYNLLKEHLRVKAGQVDFSNGLNEVADPQQQFSLRSTLDLPHQLEFDAAFRWVDTLHNNNGPTPGTVPSYSQLDLRLAWHVTRALELSVVGQNLLDPQHPEYGFPGAGRVEMQRSAYGKVTWRF